MADNDYTGPSKDGVSVRRVPDPLAQKIDSLSLDDRKKLLGSLRRLVPRPYLSKYCPPSLSPKQEAFLSAPNLEILYGGAAGGGKTAALLIAALQYADQKDYNALILRRTFAELEMPGATMSLAAKWLSGTDARKVGGKDYVFPNGAELRFGYLSRDDDKWQYGSANYDFIAFDEAAEFPNEDTYKFLFSRLRRRIESNIPPRMRLGANPIGPGAIWLKRRFLTFPNAENLKAEPCFLCDHFHWEAKCAREKCGCLKNPNSEPRLYVPARLDDNPFIDVQSYLRSLAQLDPYTRQALRNGDWDAKPPGKMFRREWFKIAASIPRSMYAYRVRFWDLAACLIAGTKIETKRGIVPIERVTTNDLVMTQHGYRRVKRSCLSNYVNELVTVVFSDGSHLTGTSDHPVYVEGGYWIGLGDMMGSDKILHRSELKSWGDRETYLWKKDILKGDATFANQGDVISTATSGTKRERSRFTTRSIARSGNLSTGRFPLATIFTTKTRTSTTTKLTIWSASPKAITVNSIGELQSLGPQCGASLISTLERFAQEQLRLMRDGNATSASGAGFGLPPKASRHDFAAAAIAYAQDGETNTTHGVPVYDLTVEDAHAFFANGILVHNTQEDKNKNPSWTCGVRMSYDNGLFLVEDVKRVRETPGTVKDLIMQTAAIDGSDVEIWIEQEPGSSGIAVIDDYIRSMPRFAVRPFKASGPKETRAAPFAAQAEGGNIKMIEGPWNEAFLEELEQFPSNTWKNDQVDASAGAYNVLAENGEFVAPESYGERIKPDWDMA